jgi:hypothetical protein
MNNLNKLLLISALGIVMGMPKQVDHRLQYGVPEKDKHNTGTARAKRNKAKKLRTKNKHK